MIYTYGIKWQDGETIFYDCKEDVAPGNISQDSHNDNIVRALYLIKGGDCE